MSNTDRICEQNLIDRTGFYDEIPSFNKLRQLVRQRAYKLWEVEKPEGKDQDFWLEAERQLFKGFVEGGYVICFCDLSLPENQGFKRHWTMELVTPQGVRNFDLTLEK